MTHRQTAVAVLLCTAVAAVIAGLIAMLWHIIPEEYSLVMRWVSYGLICIGVQCGCLLVRCLCLRQTDSWCRSTNPSVTPACESGGPSSVRSPARSVGLGPDPDDKPPAYNQVVWEEGHPPPPFLDAVRRESMDEALQAETEVEFLQEVLEARRQGEGRTGAQARWADSETSRGEIEARRTETETCEEARRGETEARQGEELVAEAQVLQQTLCGTGAGDETGQAECAVEAVQSKVSRVRVGVPHTENEGCQAQTEAPACETSYQTGTEAATSPTEVESEVSPSNQSECCNTAAEAAQIPPEVREVKTDGDILLAEALRAEAASKALLAECMAATCESQTATPPNEDRLSDSKSGCSQTVRQDTSNNTEPSYG